MPIDVGNGAAEKRGDFIGGGAFTGGHGKERREVEGVDAFELLHGGFDFFAVGGDEGLPAFRCGLIQHSEERTAVAEQSRMLAGHGAGAESGVGAEERAAIVFGDGEDDIGAAVDFHFASGKIVGAFEIGPVVGEFCGL